MAGASVGVTGLWRVSATALALLIAVNLLLMALNPVAWLVIDLMALAAMMFYCYKQGAAVGHAACGVSDTVAAARAAGDQVYAQLDHKYLAQAYSRQNAFRGALAGALIPYAAGGVYIALSLVMAEGLPLLAARTAAWLLSLPYWPVVMSGHANFVALTPDIAAMLMITPFILPACTALGYLQGPRLWARSEEIMQQGRRRAKARSRVGKKLAPKVQKPEI